MCMKSSIECTQELNTFKVMFNFRFCFYGTLIFETQIYILQPNSIVPDHPGAQQ